MVTIKILIVIYIISYLFVVAGYFEEGADVDVKNLLSALLPGINTWIAIKKILKK